MCIVVHTDMRRETGLAGSVPIQIRGQIANERQRRILSRLERFGNVGDGHRGTADGGSRLARDRRATSRRRPERPLKLRRPTTSSLGARPALETCLVANAFIHYRVADAGAEIAPSTGGDGSECGDFADGGHRSPRRSSSWRWHAAHDRTCESEASLTPVTLFSAESMSCRGCQMAHHSTSSPSSFSRLLSA